MVGDLPCIKSMLFSQLNQNKIKTKKKEDKDITTNRNGNKVLFLSIVTD